MSKGIFPWIDAWWVGAGATKSGTNVTIETSGSGIGVFAGSAAPLSRTGRYRFHVTHTHPDTIQIGCQYTKYAAWDSASGGSASLGDTWIGVFNVSAGSGYFDISLPVDGSFKAFRLLITPRGTGYAVTDVKVEALVPLSDGTEGGLSVFDGSVEKAAFDMVAVDDTGQATWSPTIQV